MALPAVLARLAPLLARGGALAKGGLVRGGGAIGLGSRADLGKFVGQEVLKYGVLQPTFRQLGLGGKTHAAAPIPGVGATPLRDRVLYGVPRQGGLFGSDLGILGGRKAIPGLLERQMQSQSKYKKSLLQAQLQGLASSNATDLQRQRLVSNTQTFLGQQQTQRDIMSARLNNASNTSANIAMIVSGRGINTPTQYGSPMVQGATVAPPGQRQQISSYGSSYANPYYGAQPPHRKGYRGRGRYYY